MASLLIAAALFSRYGIHGALARDEAVYAYGGQQVEDGMPFYVSIFDQKTPGAAYLAALAVGIGNVVGVADLEAIRVMFFVCACLTVVAVYLLAIELWGSVVAALVAATTFAAFRGFAIDALGGPDAKTPGILLAVLSMWLIARRRWLWAGLCGALAFLVWQPLLIYLAVALAVAARRRLVVAGAAVPLVATAAYFWATGALGAFIQAAFVFPVEGLHRTPATIGQRLGHIITVVHDHYQGAVVQFWLGLAVLIVLGAVALWRRRFADPLVRVVLPTLVVIARLLGARLPGLSRRLSGAPVRGARARRRGRRRRAAPAAGAAARRCRGGGAGRHRRVGAVLGRPRARHDAGGAAHRGGRHPAAARPRRHGLRARRPDAARCSPTAATPAATSCSRRASPAGSSGTSPAGSTAGCSGSGLPIPP